jgi:hypothetical protein
MDLLDFYQKQLVATKNYLAEVSQYQLLVLEAKQQVEAANAYVKELGDLFQQQGDHQKEVDEIFARMATSMTAKVTKTENKADLFPVKGQELHVYTGNRPLALGEHPSGILLCKAIFGEKATVIISGEASYGLLVKNNQYVASINIDTVPSKGTLCISDLFLCQGDYFTIDNW